MALELEHLGALDWVEQADGSFEFTGQPSFQLMPVTASKPTVEGSVEFGKNFTPLAVNAAELVYFGAGDEWMGPTELIQYITGANYLLSYYLPDDVVTEKFLDYELMRRQIDGFASMVLNLGGRSPAAFDTPPTSGTDGGNGKAKTTNGKRETNRPTSGGNEKAKQS